MITANPEAAYFAKNTFSEILSPEEEKLYKELVENCLNQRPKIDDFADIYSDQIRSADKKRSG